VGPGLGDVVILACFDSSHRELLAEDCGVEPV
jgi:hypothetical protein